MTFNACKKDNNSTTNPTNNNTSGNYYFRCKVDGESWSATVPVGADTTFFGDPAFVIYNNNSTAISQVLIGILWYNSTWILTEGTYTNDLSDDYDEIQLSPGPQLACTVDSTARIINGTFTVRLKDTFSGDVVNITDGEFRVAY